MTHTQLLGDRRGLNPHLLVHSEACTPVHHGHRAVPRAGIEPTSPASRAGSRPPIGESVGVEGIEPPSAVCRTAALPLDETPVGAARVELAPSCSRNRRLPIKPSRRGIDSGRTTHPWFDAGRGVGVEILPTPATFRVSLQPGDESLRARAADRHVGSVIVPRRRVERATATETAFGGVHGVLLSAFVK